MDDVTQVDYKNPRIFHGYYNYKLHLNTLIT